MPIWSGAFRNCLLDVSLTTPGMRKVLLKIRTGQAIRCPPARPPVRPPPLRPSVRPKGGGPGGGPQSLSRPVRRPPVRPPARPSGRPSVRSLARPVARHNLYCIWLPLPGYPPGKPYAIGQITFECTILPVPPGDITNAEFKVPGRSAGFRTEWRQDDCREVSSSALWLAFGRPESRV